jgi:hypothetical protein
LANSSFTEGAVFLFLLEEHFEVAGTAALPTKN